MVDQGLGFRRRALVPIFRQHGHEGLGKGALGKHAAEQIGQAEGDEKRVGGGPGTEHPGDDEIADKTKDAREQGHATDRGQGFEQIHGRILLAKPACNVMDEHI